MDEINNMDLNLFKTFLKVAKNGSISKAANQLMVSQPSVSYSIKELENQLNCKLFIRNSKGVELTADAQKLLFYVEHAFNTLNTGYKMLNDSSDFLTGEIKVGVPTHIGIFFLSQYIQKFNEQYPGIKFSIVNKSTNEMIKLLEKRELDLIVDSYPIESKREDVTISELFEIDNCFVANEKYLGIIENNKKIKIESLNKYQLLLPPKGTSTRDMLEETIKEKVGEINALIDVPTTEVMLDLVKRGMGIGYFSKNAVERYINSGRLYEIPVDCSLPKTIICMACVENFLTSAPKEFCSIIKDDVKKIEMIKKKAIRLVLTSECIYNCKMCHKEGIKDKRENNLNSEDIEFLYNTLNKNFGITKVNITGGEPLLREDIKDIVNKLSNDGAKVNITTNGYLLNNFMDTVKKINHLNISLHSLNKEKFEQIIGAENKFETVINNIKKLRVKYPTINININMTLIKGLNDDINEIEDMIKFCKSLKANLKIIELYPKNTEKFVDIKEIIPILQKNKFILQKTNFRNRFFSDNNTEIVLVKCSCSAISEYNEKEEKCRENNDLYITPDCKISLCRETNFEIDIYNEIKTKSEQELISKVTNALNIMGKGCQIK